MVEYVIHVVTGQDPRQPIEGFLWPEPPEGFELWRPRPTSRAVTRWISDPELMAYVIHWHDSTLTFTVNAMDALNQYAEKLDGDWVISQPLVHVKYLDRIPGRSFQGVEEMVMLLARRIRPGETFPPIEPMLFPSEHWLYMHGMDPAHD